MDLTLSPEQTLIKQGLDRFVAASYLDGRPLGPRPEIGFSREHWASFAERGWLGLPIPEGRGGIGGTALDTMIVMEAFGAGPVAEPYVSCVVVPGSLLADCAGGTASAALDGLIAGTTIVTLAYAEPHAGYAPNRVATTARRDGDAFVIDGHKAAVPYANVADRFIVSVRTAGRDDAPDGITLIVVPADAPGMTRREYETYDERRASDLSFSGVRVPARDVLGSPDAGLEPLERALDRGTAALCAEAVGAMGVLQRRTLEYLKTRTQFGRPIGSFQALQHRAVDMLIQLELARAIATYAAATVDSSDAAERRRAAAAAKVLVCDASRFVGEQAIQLHGAIGLTAELYVGHYVKRLTMLQRELGDGAYAIKRYIGIGE